MRKPDPSVGDGLFLLWLIVLSVWAIGSGYAFEWLVISGTVLAADRGLKYWGRRKRTEK